MIYLLGVSHIKVNIERVIQELGKLNIGSNTLIFIEPKKNVLIGIERCDNKSVEFFFERILEYIILKKAKIVPLNPKYMPSHKSLFLYQKYAKQFAEEEYMTDLIRKTEHDGDKVVIIGDVHALRINRLLREKGCETKHIRLAPLTPDDVISYSWRDALEGRSSKFISISWLKAINDEIKEKMGLPKNVNVQEACWNNEYLYVEYLDLVKELMKKHRAEDFTFAINKQMKELSRESKENGKAILDKFNTIEDHPTFSFPYEIKINTLTNSA